MTASKARKQSKLSALDAAAKVLGGSKEPMGCKEMIEAMAEKKLWISPGGKTPSATLYSSILREITTNGKESRFKKAERGKFVATGKRQSGEKSSNLTPHGSQVWAFGRCVRKDWSNRRSGN